MNVLSYLAEEFRWAHELLEMVMADVTPEQLRWQPPGIANPLGAVYAHAVLGEDGVVGGLLKGDAPLYAASWADKTGVSAPQMDMEHQWARDLEVDLLAFREYAHAVYGASEAYLAGLTEAELDRVLDLTDQGMGHRTVGWCLSSLVLSHLNNMTGEASCLKGLQGARGYPF